MWVGPGAGLLTTQLLGDPSGGMWRALWTRAQLSGGQGWDPQSPLLGYPLGAPVTTPSPLTDIVGSWLGPLIGQVPTHNLLLLSALVLASSGAALLGRSQELRRSSSLVVGLGYALSAPLISMLVSSSAELLALGLLPWLLLGLERLARRSGPLPWLLALSSGLACVLADLNQLVVLGLLLPVVGLGLVLRDRRLLPWLASLAVLGPLAAWGLTQPFLAALESAGELATPSSPQLWGPAGAEAGDLRGVATMSALARPGGLQIQGSLERELFSAYLGWALIGLALVGAQLRSLRWTLLALVAAVLALGPWAPVDIGAERSSPAAWWLAAWDTWPLSRSLDLPARALPMTSLALAVLAGMGLERLQTLLPRARPALLPLAMLGVALEPLLLTGLGWPLQSTPLPQAEHVTAMDGPGAVIDWPHVVRGREFGEDLALQLQHGRPVPWDLSEAEGPNGIDSNGLLRVLEASTRGQPLAMNEARRGAWVLQQQGVAWLVVHPHRLGEADAQAAVALVDELLPLHAELPGGLRVYRMEP